MHLVTHGGDSGTPVLALHGWPVDHRLMAGCLEPIFTRRAGYRRLYPDLPGMGRTPAGDAASSDDLLAAVLALVGEELGTTPFLLVGESYGGYLSRAVVGALPDQVLGLALICPVGQTLDRAARVRPPHVVLRSTPGLLDAPAGGDSPGSGSDGTGSDSPGDGGIGTAGAGTAGADTAGADTAGTGSGDASGAVDGLDEAARAEFAEYAVVQTPETLRRFRDEIVPALQAADTAAIERIERRWHLSEGPEGPVPFERPTLFLCGRQDSSVGYVDQFALLPHYPRATFAVLDVAGHNLQIEQPALFETLMEDWLDRCAAEPPR